MTTEELASAYANVLYQETSGACLRAIPETPRTYPDPISRPDRIEVTVRDETLPAYRLAPVALLKDVRLLGVSILRNGELPANGGVQSPGSHSRGADPCVTRIR